MYQNGTTKIDIRVNTGDTDYFTDLKIEAGENTTQYSSYNMGCASIVVNNSNIARLGGLGTDVELTANGIKNINLGRFNVTTLKVAKGQTIKTGFKLLTQITAGNSCMIGCYVNGKSNSECNFNNIEEYELNKLYERTYTATEDCIISFDFSGNSSQDIFEFQFWINLDELEEYTPNQSELKIVEIQKSMKSGDYFTKEADVWKEIHTNTLEKLTCTETQSTQLDDLLNTITYKNLTYIYSTDTVSPIIKLTYVKDLETYINKSQEEQNIALQQANTKIAELEATVALQDEQIPRRRRRRRKHNANR